MNRPFISEGDKKHRVAVFIDFENVKRSVDDFFENDRVDFKLILDEIVRMTQGRVLLKRAYADWSVFKEYRSDLLDNAIEPVQTFPLTQKGKNGADIRMAVDVVEFVLRQPEITHVAIISGDSDFTPLVMKLRELGLHVLGLGVRSNTASYLIKACDRFVFYDDLREAPTADPVGLLTRALTVMGNRPVPGSALKIQMRRLDPLFDETRLGYGSFLEFLRANLDIVDVHKPQVGDVTVAPQGTLELEEGAIYTPPTAGDKLRSWLRENNFRYVTCEERHQIIVALYDIFAKAEASGGVSLKEAKDQLHAFVEEHFPTISWDSVNSAVYHLFYTWCFYFDRGDETDSKQLWDRKTSLQPDILSADDLIEKTERGIARKLWERDREGVDAEALNEWLYDGNPEDLESVKELIEIVSAPDYTTVGRTGGG
ncbi:NYN domain-containing protein [Armatimonas sp.]|uniref:NYN domain-containing protein n=1 Tax=Armatimonas sp. TaxID=1872638 RepID=UPI00286BD7E6|nr:NYN domain-containing protein [Armatimonas sp.]